MFDFGGQADLIHFTPSFFLPSHALFPQLQSLSRSSSSSSSDSETEQPPERPDTELTKAAPPSYHASSNYPTGDPLKTPPTDLPPPYPGPPTAPASAGYPPASLRFSPVASNYQGSPPTNPTPYPPEAPSLELAYPPNGEN